MRRCVSTTSATLAVLLVIVSFGASTALAALSQPVTSTQMQRLYNRQCNELLSGKWGDWQESMSADFFVISPEGKREGRNSLVDNAQKAAEQVTFRRCFAIVHSMQRRGNIITVWVTNGSEAVAKVSEKPWKQTSVGDSKDTWMFYGNNLLETSSTDMRGKIMVNGKIVKEFGLKKTRPP